MTAKTFLIALICISAAMASGPVFILDRDANHEVYYNDWYQVEDVQSFADPDEMNCVYIVFESEMNSTVNIIEDYVKLFNSSLVFPHVNGTLNASQVFVPTTLEELQRIEVEGKQVILQFMEPMEETPEKVIVTESRSGVPMTPSVMFALLTIFTLGYSFYAAVKCVEAVQTPTVYTTKGLAVGKEF